MSGLILTITVIALIFLPCLIGIGGSLYRISTAIEAQNKHYGIEVEKK